jgi:hypothetical protein
MLSRATNTIPKMNHLVSFPPIFATAAILSIEKYAIKITIKSVIATITSIAGTSVKHNSDIANFVFSSNSYKQENPVKLIKPGVVQVCPYRELF